MPLQIAELNFSSDIQSTVFHHMYTCWMQMAAHWLTCTLCCAYLYKNLSIVEINETMFRKKGYKCEFFPKKKHNLLLTIPDWVLKQYFDPYDKGSRIV